MSAPSKLRSAPIPQPLYHRLCRERNTLLIATRRNRKLTRRALERTKELRCMYRIASLVAAKISLEEILQSVAEVTPEGWQFPELASCEIVIGDTSFKSKSYRDSSIFQNAELSIDGRGLGQIRVNYIDAAQQKSTHPFLDEEQDLIQHIARVISIAIARHQEEKRLETVQAQLLHADRLATLGQLAAGIAHELNEPLGNILGLAELLSDNGSLDSTGKADIQHIKNASIYSREIIRKLLVFAREAPISRESIDLNSVIRDSLFLFEARCSKESIHLSVHYAPKMGLVFGDPGQIKQVIINLVVNAIQSMPTGGRLTMETRFDSDFAFIEICDSGHGIPEDIREKIFLPFFTTKDVNQGTGLGLAVAYGIMKAHEGSIEVDSDPKTGSCFRLQFPIAHDSQE